MSTSNITLHFDGLSTEEISSISKLLETEAIINNESSTTTRMSNELISAAFILGVINATPPLIKAITELITDIRRNKYFTIKLVLDNGETTVEGAATPERIAALATALNKLRTDKK